MKLVVVDKPEHAEAVESELSRLIGGDEIRRVGDVALVVHSQMTTSALRDAVSDLLGRGAVALVVEFERWSGSGAEIDSVWLMSRGH